MIRWGWGDRLLPLVLVRGRLGRESVSRLAWSRVLGKPRRAGMPSCPAESARLWPLFTRCALTPHLDTSLRNLYDEHDEPATSCPPSGDIGGMGGEPPMKYLGAVWLLGVAFCLTIVGCRSQLRWLEITNTTQREVRVKIGERVMPDTISARSKAVLSEQVFRGGTFECQILDRDGTVLKHVLLDGEDLFSRDDGETIRISL